MSLFDKIKHAVFGDKGPLGQFGGSKPAPAPAPAPRAAAPVPRPAVAAAPKPAPAPAPAAQPVDVDAVLTRRAADKGKPSNWRTSIVDLLQLLDLDSSLTARKELAAELNVHAGDHGSAEQNMALHRAVMKQLAANGGKVPAELQD